MDSTNLPIANLRGLDRKGKMLFSISPTEQEGLEIGPLCWPIVTKTESNGRIYYVDYSNAEFLRNKYKKDPAVNINEIVEIDYLWGEKTLSEIVNGKPFDYVVASHVIEHVPNMLGWLREVAEILKDGGILSLAIPDKRYTFDIKKELTSMGELVEAYLLNSRRPTPKNIFDHKSLACKVDMVSAWNGGIDIEKLEHSGSLEDALVLAQKYLLTTEYQDAHVNILTPSRFLDLIEASSRLGLFDYIISAFYDTYYNSHEFLVSLKRIPKSLSREQQLELQLSNISKVRESLMTSGVNILLAHSASNQTYDTNIKTLKIAVSIMNIGSLEGHNLVIKLHTDISDEIDANIKETNPVNGQVIGTNIINSIKVGQSRTLLLSILFKEKLNKNIMIFLEVYNQAGEIVGQKMVPINIKLN